MEVSGQRCSQTSLAATEGKDSEGSGRVGAGRAGWSCLHWSRQETTAV